MALKPVSVVRSYEQVVHQLQNEILNGGFVGGQKLPTERELGAHFNVSRSVVREAVKFLDAMGLVESRQGSGIYVRTHPVPSIARALTLSVTTEKASVHELCAFRELLEVHAAAEAARRRSEAQLTAIRQAATVAAQAARQDSVTALSAVFADADGQFHTAVGEASGNRYLATVMTGVYQLLHDLVEIVIRQSGSIAVAAEQHLRIAAAIADRAPDEAAAAMREHLRFAATTLYGTLQPTPEG